MGASVQMKEPDWCNMGYGVNCYEAKCKYCEETARLAFGDNEKELLTIKCQDELGRKQMELCEFVFHFVLIKLRRECNCDINRKV